MIKCQKKSNDVYIALEITRNLTMGEIYGFKSAVERETGSLCTISIHLFNSNESIFQTEELGLRINNVNCPRGVIAVLDNDSKKIIPYNVISFYNTFSVKETAK